MQSVIQFNKLKTVQIQGRNMAQKKKHPLFIDVSLGGPSGTRTPDQPVMSRLL